MRNQKANSAISNSPKIKSSLWILTLGGWLAIGSQIAVAAEIVCPYKRISLNESSFNRQERTRVMLYSSDFSLYPKLYAGATYIPQPQTPGVSGAEAAIGQLIASLVIRGMNSKDNEDAVHFKAKIQESLKALDIKQELQNALIKELKSRNMFDSMEFEHSSRVHDLAQPGLLIRVEEKNILTLSANVSFDSALTAVYVSASSKLWLKNKTTPIYYSDFTYLSDKLKDDSLKTLRNRWSENDGELLKAKIQEGITEVAYMLASDLQRTKSDELNYIADMELLNPYTGKKSKANFYPVEEKSERLIGRPDSLESALLISTPRK